MTTGGWFEKLAKVLLEKTGFLDRRADFNLMTIQINP
jgi:hypothetical protein